MEVWERKFYFYPSVGGFTKKSYNVMMIKICWSSFLSGCVRIYTTTGASQINTTIDRQCTAAVWYHNIYQVPGIRQLVRIRIPGTKKSSLKAQTPTTQQEGKIYILRGIRTGTFGINVLMPQQFVYQGIYLCPVSAAHGPVNNVTREENIYSVVFY